MSDVITLKNLGKIYRKTHLWHVYETTGIEDVSLSIKEGEIFGLLGLNGSGKTTTIKLILGLLKPTFGSAEIFGKKVYKSPGVLKDIGYLPEVSSFYRYLTAKEILKFYGNLSGVKNLNKRADDILDTVGLYECKDKKLSDFSKGMLQRIGIAQSLIHNPSVLIYDEPVSGLDPLAVKEIRQLILKLKSLGKTIFLSSHLISEVEKISDRVGILARGRLSRILNQPEWVGNEGELERVFEQEVSGTQEFGRIKICSQ